ncbi:SHOCT domain-containing protein [Cellulomonas palmilytica]|uniref:SHOCT domain-containing protein n=1 Tax=Cellulomonas palmilytica TaxID=2608402 RepID=UPI001F19EE51|nr:SHOCT domain-containing protein [Cellulomonas palmilytica]UJP40507.1 SHOCT domain-containing protein [Cellulomonas palmilytica]
MNFWQWVLLLLWWFLFFAYLVILFQILSDLFRDSAVSGWLKAVWILFLVLFPYLTALVYVIARGKGMAERQGRRIEQARAETDSYIRDVAGAKSPADHIADAKALLDSGAITPEEFAQLKAKALAA